jgi:hypothetical protein
VIRIYGASDDLIEVEGDISEEFQYLGGEDMLAFSDGTLLSIRYDKQGIWRITVVSRGAARLTHIVCTSDGFSDDEYSDAVHLFDEELDKPITWVLYGVDLARRRR